MTTIRLRLVIVFIFSILISGCASRLITLEQPPADKNISGTWYFVSQDEVAYRDFKQRAQYASTRALTSIKTTSSNQRRRRMDSDLPNHLLMDMVVSLVSLPINELFIEQTGKSLAIDYGVAGYHRFDIAKANELVIGGAELKATAGWKENQMHVQMVITDRFQIVQRFRLMDKSNLLETLTLNMGDERSISHQRWYSLKTD